MARGCATLLLFSYAESGHRTVAGGLCLILFERNPRISEAFCQSGIKDEPRQRQRVKKNVGKSKSVLKCKAESSLKCTSIESTYHLSTASHLF